MAGLSDGIAIPVISKKPMCYNSDSICRTKGSSQSNGYFIFNVSVPPHTKFGPDRSGHLGGDVVTHTHTDELPNSWSRNKIEEATFYDEL